MTLKESSVKESQFHIDETLSKHKEGSEVHVSTADSIFGDLTAGDNSDI